MEGISRLGLNTSRLYKSISQLMEGISRLGLSTSRLYGAFSETK